VQVLRDFQFRTHESLFTQVIDNLVKNALRSLAATPTARQRGDLRIEVNVVDGRGLITVADRGLGMRDELKARIFQLFVSTSGGTGHGLGLAFCQRVVNDARGSIRVESAPSRGAQFIIELPLVQPSPLPQPTLERISQ
jgi:two-component system, CAI-1 autoinducer sensor kinase/phosphatase CqsS